LLVPHGFDSGYAGLAYDAVPAILPFNSDPKGGDLNQPAIQWGVTFPDVDSQYFSNKRFQFIIAHISSRLVIKMLLWFGSFFCFRNLI